MIKLSHPHQDPSSAVLNVLEPLEALARDPDEECITIIQPGGDKGVDELLGIWQGECGAEFGNVTEMKKGGLAQMFDVGLEVELWV